MHFVYTKHPLTCAIRCQKLLIFITNGFASRQLPVPLENENLTHLGQLCLIHLSAII